MRRSLRAVGREPRHGRWAAVAVAMAALALSGCAPLQPAAPEAARGSRTPTAAAVAAIGAEAEIAQDPPLRPLSPQPPIAADAPVSLVAPALPAGPAAGDDTPGAPSLPRADGGTEFFERGGASWYGIAFHNRRTASGERFDMGAFTAAHRTLPFGSRICVHSLVNGRTVLVRVNDRGPASPQRVIDLSRAAAEALGMLGLGIKQVALSHPAPGQEDCAPPP